MPLRRFVDASRNHKTLVQLRNQKFGHAEADFSVYRKMKKSLSESETDSVGIFGFTIQ